MRLPFIAVTLLLLGLGSTGLRAADDDSALFSDDFATLRPGWGQSSASQSVTSNWLILRPPSDSVYRTLYNDAKFENADIRVKVSQTQGTTDEPGGLIFWATDLGSYYAVLIQSDGSLDVVRRMAGQWIFPVPMKARDELRKGISQVNELRVVTSGNVATIYANDKQIAAFKGFPPAGGGKIGMHVESGAGSFTWAFSGLSVRKGPSPAASQAPTDDSLLFADDFSTFDPGWGSADATQDVGNNKLTVTLAPQKIRRLLYRGSLFDNADIRVSVSESKGNPDQAGGIAFWAIDNDNYYAAVVQPDGNFYVTRFINGNALYPVSSKVRDEVNKGLGQMNALRVVTSGKLATIYVNDTQVATFKGYPPAGPSKIGMHAESGTDPSTWSFSGVSVHKGPPPSESTTPADDSVLFAEDFSTFDPAWGYADATRSVSDKKLIENLDPEKVRTHFYMGTLFDNADIRLKVSEVKGNTDQSGGIIFWGTDSANHYAALVQPDGSFYVARFAAGKSLYPIGSKVRDEVNKGLGQTNELRVVTSGNVATIFVNGTQVASFKGYPPEGGGKIGVHAESGTDPAMWTFSELSVRKGPTPPVSTTPTDDSLLLADDFSTLEPAWGEPTDIKSVSGNALILQPPLGKITTLFYQGAVYGDADISVKFSVTKGATNSPGGLIFWAADTNNYQVVFVQADGGFLFARQKDGKWNNPVGMEVRSEVNKGLGRVNSLRVVCKDKVAKISVNDQQIVTYEVKVPAGPCKIGLCGESAGQACTFSFSDLVIRKPE
jgi:hypothetical protein